METGDAPRRSARRLLIALLVALVIPAPAVAAEGGSAAGRQSTSPVVGQGVAESSEEAEGIRDFWTRERMREARPVDVAPGGRVKRPGDPDASVSEGRPAFVAPTRRGSSGHAALETGTIAARRSGGRRRLSHVPFDRYEVPDTTAYPNRTNGRLLLRQGGATFACSATVVTSEIKSLVFTAGHCLHDGGRRGDFASKVVFVPGYRDGQRPFGTFVARRIVVTDGWADGANSNFDVGAAELRRNGVGQKVEPAVGSRGIAFSQQREQLFRAYGYPAAPPFDGQRLFACESSYAGDDPNADPAGPPAMLIGCDLTAGSSGGSWVFGDGYVNSVISYSYEDVSDTYGPYFGRTVKRLWKSVARK